MQCRVRECLTPVLLTVFIGSASGQSDNAASLLNQPNAETPQFEAGSSEDNVSLSLSIAVTSQYFFRGILQESSGLITQPSATVTIDMKDATGLPFSILGGVWNSFHDRGTGATNPDDFVSRWYEFDLYAGVETSIDRWSFGLLYTLYASPNGAFGNVDEISAAIGFDDSDLLPVALAPSVTVAFEFGENEADGGTGQGIFLGVGIAPEFALIEEGNHPVTLTLPAEVGLSLSDYYEDATGSDDFFGYARVGADLSVDLPMHAGYGSWSLSGGVGLILLGDNTSQVNNGDDVETQFTIGISAEL